MRGAIAKIGQCRRFQTPSSNLHPPDSNREPLRLEFRVTQTKQTIRHHSNREKEAWFFGPSRGGSFLSDPPTFRPRTRRRIHPAELQIHPTPRHQNSNREKDA
jgi:hypothetical protein